MALRIVHTLIFSNDQGVRCVLLSAPQAGSTPRPAIAAFGCAMSHHASMEVCDGLKGMTSRQPSIVARLLSTASLGSVLSAYELSDDGDAPLLQRVREELNRSGTVGSM